MNKIDAFFVMASLLLIWTFAILLLPFKVMIFVYAGISAWWVGTSIGNIPRKLAKETDRDFLYKMYSVSENQNRTMVEMLECLNLAAASNRALLARIDALMFEYCPDEMTEAQIANYWKHVRVATKEEEDEIERVLRH
jgi:hypothetical protein